MEYSPTLQQLNKAKLLKMELLKGCAERVLQSTIQFLFFESKPKYPAAGSGVLFEINDRYFIITAAHVAEQNRGDGGRVGSWVRAAPRPGHDGGEAGKPMWVLHAGRHHDGACELDPELAASMAIRSQSSGKVMSAAAAA